MTVAKHFTRLYLSTMHNILHTNLFKFKTLCKNYMPTLIISQFSKLPCLITIKIRLLKSKHKAYLQTSNVHRHGTMRRALVVGFHFYVQDDWPCQDFRRPNGLLLFWKITDRTRTVQNRYHSMCYQ